MKYYPFMLSFFFLLFIGFYSIPTHAQIGDMSRMKAEGPVDIEADELTYDRETQIFEAHGQVEVYRGDLSLKGDHVQLNMATKNLVAWGNVLLREGEDVIECQRLEINIETRMGKIHQARLFIKDQNFHITARETEKLGENHYRIRDSSVTTCDAEQPPWKFTVKELEVKEMALGGFATAKGAVFYLEDIPVLYFPWGAFPVRVERQSGFLLPQVGYSNKYGPEIKTGFYWAMRKDMDATFYLNYLGERGVQEGWEYRYAFTQDTKAEATFYFIDDHVYDSNRYAFFIKGQQKLPDDFYLKTRINYVSDNEYPIDFDDTLPDETSLDARSLRLMRSVLFGGKNWDQFSFLADAEFYQDLTINNNDITIQKLPKISFYGLPQSLFKTPVFYEFSTSYTNFWRETGVEAQRGDLFPLVSYPMRLFNVLKVNPYLGFRETFYYSQNDPTGTYKGWESRETFNAGFQTSVEFFRVYDAETFPYFSNLFKVAKWMHTIEPTFSYNYSSQADQSRIPIFDDVDRVPYANEITYGITQRLVGRPAKETTTSGPFEYAKLMIFQSYSLGNPSWFNPQFIDENGKKRSFSNIGAELWLNFSPYLSARWSAEFNPYRGNFDVMNFLITAKDQRNDVVRFQYRYTKGEVNTINVDTGVNQINLDARVKTIEPLYIFLGTRYDLLNHYMVATVGGAEYQAQCWSLGFSAEYWGQPPAGTRQSEFKFKVYFTLLNLGTAGSRPYFMNL
jgi:LPS-assembly protein